MNKKLPAKAKSPVKRRPTSVNKPPAGHTKARGALRRPRDRDSLEEQLRAAISTVDVAYALTTPLLRSLENLLRLAARTINSGEASVLVRDGDSGGLKFLVAIGAVAPRLIGVQIPPGRGIAGFVFASGQPMAVADAKRESTFYAEIDRATGYSTETILATPLQLNGETVGVLEFVNRRGQPPYEPFAPHEMDWAARFADAIAALVDAHEATRLIETLLTRALKTAADTEDGGKVIKRAGGKTRRASQRQTSPDRSQDRGAALQQWLKTVQAAPEHRELVSLAVTLHEVASRGEAERTMCREMLESLARWTERRHTTGSGTEYLF
ncbi:MAG: GAF domain-containing protein [Acidobacteriota bacterium]|nr:GAF domain-containing protein [Acidobacteriota bacterium]